MAANPWTAEELTRLADLAARLPRLPIREIALHFPGHGQDGVRKRSQRLRSAPAVGRAEEPDAPPLFNLRCLRCGRPFWSVDRVRNRICGICNAQGNSLGPDMAMTR